MNFALITALITPFLKNGKVDFNNLCRLIDYQLKYKVDKFVLFGTTGEGSLIDNKEKYLIIKKLIKRYGLLIELIIGISQISTKKALEEVKYFSNLQINGFLVLSPCYLKTNEAGVINHYLKIAQNTSLPVYLYYIPKRTGQVYSYKIIEALKKQKNIVGIKDASDDLNYFQQLLTYQEENFQVYMGNDSYLIDSLDQGNGIISVISNAYPLTIVKIIELYNGNKIAEAKSLFNKIKKMIDLLFSEPNPIPIKYVMSKLLNMTNNYHLPLYNPTKETKKALDDEIRRLENEYFISR